MPRWAPPLCLWVDQNLTPQNYQCLSFIVPGFLKIFEVCELFDSRINFASNGTILSCTVESRFNELPRDRGNAYVISRVR